MDETGDGAAIVLAFKAWLRRKKITYDQLAAKSGYSSQTIKRGFAKKDFSLHKLSHLCKSAGIDIFTLTESALNEEKQKHFLSVEEQNFFIAYPYLFTLFIAAISNNSKALDLQKARYHLDDQDLYHHLRELEKAGFIEVLENNRVRTHIKSEQLVLGPILSSFLYDKMFSQVKQSVFSEGNQHGFDVSLQCKIPLSAIDSFKKKLQTTLDDHMASWARGASY